MYVHLHVHIFVVSVCLFASMYASLHVCAPSCAHSRGVYICASCVYVLMHHVRKQYMKKKIDFFQKKITMHHVDVHAVRCTYPVHLYAYLICTNSNYAQHVCRIYVLTLICMSHMRQTYSVSLRKWFFGFIFFVIGEKKSLLSTTLV
jgi:hypothetical protein